LLYGWWYYRYSRYYFNDVSVISLWQKLIWTDAITDTAYLDNRSYDVLQLTAWIPMMNATTETGCMQVRLLFLSGWAQSSSRLPKILKIQGSSSASHFFTSAEMWQILWLQIVGLNCLGYEVSMYQYVCVCVCVCVCGSWWGMVTRLGWLLYISAVLMALGMLCSVKMRCATLLVCIVFHLTVISNMWFRLAAKYPVWAQEHRRVSPPRFLAELKVKGN